jgi:hypothetical protein
VELPPVLVEEDPIEPPPFLPGDEEDPTDPEDPLVEEFPELFSNPLKIPEFLEFVVDEPPLELLDIPP